MSVGVDEHLPWLLEGDPAIRWRVLRDFTDAPEADLAREQSRVAAEGWGARLLAAQNADGGWGDGVYSIRPTRSGGAASSSSPIGSTSPTAPAKWPFAPASDFPPSPNGISTCSAGLSTSATAARSATTGCATPSNCCAAPAGKTAGGRPTPPTRDGNGSSWNNRARAAGTPAARYASCNGGGGKRQVAGSSVAPVKWTT